MLLDLLLDRGDHRPLLLLPLFRLGQQLRGLLPEFLLGRDGRSPGQFVGDDGVTVLMIDHAVSQLVPGGNVEGEFPNWVKSLAIWISQTLGDFRKPSCPSRIPRTSASSLTVGKAVSPPMDDGLANRWSVPQRVHNIDGCRAAV